MFGVLIMYVLDESNKKDITVIHVFKTGKRITLELRVSLVYYFVNKMKVFKL